MASRIILTSSKREDIEQVENEWLHNSDNTCQYIFGMLPINVSEIIWAFTDFFFILPNKGFSISRYVTSGIGWCWLINTGISVPAYARGLITSGATKMFLYVVPVD